MQLFPCLLESHEQATAISAAACARCWGIFVTLLIDQRQEGHQGIQKERHTLLVQLTKRRPPFVQYLASTRLIVQAEPGTRSCKRVCTTVMPLCLQLAVLQGDGILRLETIELQQLGIHSGHSCRCFASDGHVRHLIYK